MVWTCQVTVHSLPWGRLLCAVWHRIFCIWMPALLRSLVCPSSGTVTLNVTAGGSSIWMKTWLPKSTLLHSTWQHSLLPLLWKPQISQSTWTYMHTIYIYIYNIEPLVYVYVQSFCCGQSTVPFNTHCRRALFSVLDEKDVHLMGQFCPVCLL